MQRAPLIALKTMKSLLRKIKIKNIKKRIQWFLMFKTQNMLLLKM
jgi:hypothetical protein